MKILGIIPARGGSKGVPGKNIKKIDGKSLIEYSIEAALNSQLITEIIVSSDDKSILDLASSYTITIHERLQELATDSSPISDTIFNILTNKYESFDYFILLQPTSPIRTPKQIDEAIRKIIQFERFNSLISVCKMSDIHPARMYKTFDNELLPIFSELQNKHRQDLPEVYFRNGSIYITKVKEFLKEKNIMLSPIMCFEMPYSQLLNIDEPRDLLIAEILIKAWKLGEL